MKITDLVRGEVYVSTTHGPVKYVGAMDTNGEPSAMFKILNRKTNGLRYWRIDLLDLHFKPVACEDSAALSAAYARDAEMAARPAKPSKARKALAWAIDTLAVGAALASFALFFAAVWLGLV